VHGLAADFLKGHPLFITVVDEFLAFVGDAPLVAHNGYFDLNFINSELERAKKPVFGRERIVDTLMLARRKHPGASNKLDDLCTRYRIDNSRRTKHGALLDAELLAEVYVELIGARQAMLGLASENAAATMESTGASLRARPAPLGPRVTDTERLAHEDFIRTLGEKTIWQDYCARPSV
jgi:DNA polymerase-3 subunit epsilon